MKKRKITCSSKKLLTQSLETNPDAPNKSEVQRKKRSQEYCKQKRKLLDQDNSGCVIDTCIVCVVNCVHHFHVAVGASFTLCY